MHLQRSEVLSFPFGRRIDQDLVDALAKMMQDRHGQPLPPLGGANAIAILPLVFLELHGLKHDEEVGLIDLVQVSKPGQELWLMNGDAHALSNCQLTAFRI